MTNGHNKSIIFLSLTLLSIKQGLHNIFGGSETTATIFEECTTAKRGCVECKRQLADNINDYLSELRERRADIKAHPGYVQEILHEGGKKARRIAQETIAEVYDKMGLS